VRALIYELADQPGRGALEIAGLCLLVRQLEWLRDMGIEDVVVEVATDPSASERAALLLGPDPLTAKARVVPTAQPIGLEALAARAGLAEDEPFLALPANLLVRAQLPAFEGPTAHTVAPPPFGGDIPAARVVVRTRAHDVADEGALVPGWALAVNDVSTAHMLSCAVLGGQADGVLIHAAEVRPGIWLARGARVAEEATLVPPVLLGPEARVFAKARLGPNVVVGKRALVEREVVLSEVHVAPTTLVGEASRIRQAHVDAHGLTSLADGSRTEIDDPLLLSSTSYRGPAPLARLLAALLWLALGGLWLLVALCARLVGRRALRTLRFRNTTLHMGALGIALLDLVPALWDVVRGRRDLVGVAAESALEDAARAPRQEGTFAPPLRPGAIDVAPVLAPGASAATLRSMWRWYLENKSATLDRQLLAGRVRGGSALPPGAQSGP